MKKKKLMRRCALFAAMLTILVTVLAVVPVSADENPLYSGLCSCMDYDEVWMNRRRYTIPSCAVFFGRDVKYSSVGHIRMTGMASHVRFYNSMNDRLFYEGVEVIVDICPDFYKGYSGMSSWCDKYPLTITIGNEVFYNIPSYENSSYPDRTYLSNDPFWHRIGLNTDTISDIDAIYDKVHIQFSGDMEFYVNIGSDNDFETFEATAAYIDETTNRINLMPYWLFGQLWDYSNYSGYYSGYQAGYDFGELVGTENGYDQGYTSGYNDGCYVGDMEGYDRGYTEGHNEGYMTGFGKGQADATSTLGALKDTVFAIFDAPVTLIDGMLNFDLFGINLLSLVKTIITLAVVALIVLAIIKFIF